MVLAGWGFRRAGEVSEGLSQAGFWVYGADHGGNRLSPSGSSLGCCKTYVWQKTTICFPNFPGAEGFF